MTERDAASAPGWGSGMTEGAARLMKAAFLIPIGTMKAACDVQKRMLEMMEEWFLRGVEGQAKDATRGGAGRPPAAGTGAPASAASGPATAAGGWGPVTPQDPVTGWGPMPPLPR